MTGLTRTISNPLVRAEAGSGGGGGAGGAAGEAFVYRHLLSWDTEPLSSDVTNFVVKVTEQNMPDSFWTVWGDGGDSATIRFKTMDGTVCDRYVSTFDDGADELTVYVKIPTVPSDSDFFLFMEYGDSNVAETNKASVFDDYVMVQDTAKTQSTDVLGNITMLTNETFPTGNAFNADSYYFTLESADATASDTFSALTCVWDRTGTSQTGMLALSDGGTSNSIAINLDNGDDIDSYDASGSGFMPTSKFNTEVGAIHSAVYTHEVGLSSTGRSLYADEDTLIQETANSTTGRDTIIFGNENYSRTTYDFEGNMHEARFSVVQQSDDFYVFEAYALNWENVYNGELQIGTGSSGEADLAVLKVTVPAALIDSSLTDFPLVIENKRNSPISAEWFALASASTISATNALNAEVETEVAYFDADEQVLRLHMKVDLSSSVDNVFYIYGDVAPTVTGTVFDAYELVVPIGYAEDIETITDFSSNDFSGSANWTATASGAHPVYNGKGLGLGIKDSDVYTDSISISNDLYQVVDCEYGTIGTYTALGVSDGTGDMNGLMLRNFTSYGRIANYGDDAGGWLEADNTDGAAERGVGDRFVASGTYESGVERSVWRDGEGKATDGTVANPFTTKTRVTVGCRDNLGEDWRGNMYEVRVAGFIPSDAWVKAEALNMGKNELYTLEQSVNHRSVSSSLPLAGYDTLHYAGTTTSYSASAFATKGIIYTIENDIALSYVNCFYNVGSDTAKLVIAEVSGSGASWDIDTILFESPVHIAPDTGSSVIPFYTGGLALSAGSTYAFLLVRTDGTTTSANQVSFPTGIGADNSDFTYEATARYASVDPQVSDAVGYNSTSHVTMHFRYSVS